MKREGFYESFRNKMEIFRFNMFIILWFGALEAKHFETG